MHGLAAVWRLEGGGLLVLRHVQGAGAAHVHCRSVDGGGSRGVGHAGGWGAAVGAGGL